MEGRNYIPPISALKLRQNPPPLTDSAPPAHFVIGDRRTDVVQHLEMQSLLADNQRLAESHVWLKQELSASQKELRHLCNAADEIKAERDAKVSEAYDQALKMEAEVKSIDESCAELALGLGDLHQLRSEKKELDEKLSKLRDDAAKASIEWNQFPMLKSEIETMQKEIQRGRAAIEHEKKVHASNIKLKQEMENYKIFMAREIEKLQVEVIDGRKRARAAAAAEGILIPDVSMI